MELQVYRNAEFGSVRTTTIGGQPYFVGKDVAGILGYANTRKALIDHVDEEDKGVTKCDTLGGKQDLIIINESGLYSLILSSKMPNAKKFKRWVTSEVLPTIRKHGLYATDDLIANPDLAIAAFTALKGEVLLTIMASLAQQESQSLSQNVKLGLQYRYQQGKGQVNHKRFMGYTKDEDGNLIIVPEEAEIIKRIYREYLEGQSLVGIGRGLEKDGILTAAGKPRWRPESVKKILQNEKYIGDALLQKTVTVDFLTKKRVKNEGHLPQYYVENSHEAIIPKELFLQVQEEIHRRSNIYTGEGKNKRIYSSKYALSAITFCGDCGIFTGELIGIFMVEKNLSGDA